MSDVDIYLYAADQQVIGGEGIDDESQLKTTVVVHVSLVIPAKFTPPERIESLTVEFKSEETLGVSLETKRMHCSCFFANIFYSSSLQVSMSEIILIKSIRKSRVRLVCNCSEARNIHGMFLSRSMH